MTIAIIPHSALSTLAFSYWKASLAVRGRIEEDGGNHPSEAEVNQCHAFLTNMALRPHIPENIRDRCRKESVSNGRLRMPEDVCAPCDGSAS